jgi:sec-independent protein translocase protein TatC
MTERWITFWEHVEEFRLTFVRSLIIVGAGFLVVLGFYEPILQFFTVQQIDSGLIRQNVQRTFVKNDSPQEKLFELPPHSWLINDPPPSSQVEGHLYYHLAPSKFLLFEQPVHSPFLIMGPIEGIILVFKVCFWLSIGFTAPFWGWIWLQFILPGLKDNERSLLPLFLLSSVVCICIGMAFAYYVTLPLANKYLIHFNNSIGQNAWTLTHYLNYVLFLCLGHAVAGELSLLLFLFVHYRLLTPAWLIAKRRYIIVISFILGALLTPPDVFTQFLLAIPLIGLYEISILYAKLRNRSRTTDLFRNF